MAASSSRSARCVSSVSSVGPVCAIMLVLLMGSACRATDNDAPAPDTPAHDALVHAELDQSAVEIKRAESIVAQEKRKRLLTLGLPEQVDDLRSRDKSFARSEVLASALMQIQKLPRIDRIQWALELVGPTRSASPESQRIIRTILESPKLLKPRVETPDFGPANLTGLERAHFANRLGSLQFLEPREQEMAIAYLLAISSDRTPLEWVRVHLMHSPGRPGRPTTPREEAVKALHKIVGLREMPALALRTGTLTGERAWPIVEAWLAPESKVAGKHLLYPGILQIEGRGAETYALELAELKAWPDRLPGLLEAVWRRVPGVEERIPAWLDSESWEDQTAAAYGIALYHLNTTGFDARLTELQSSKRRVVRSAVALARSGIELESGSPSEEAAAVEASVGAGGAASAERFLELSARGFLKASDTSFVDLSLPLADLDASENSPLRIASSIFGRHGGYDTREEALAALKSHYACLQHAQAPKVSALAARQPYDAGEDDENVACIITVGVLEREPSLLLDPEVPGRWLCWPDVYHCFLDTERDEVVGTYTGLFEDRLLPVPPDVDQAAREIFAVTGLHDEYSGAEGGLIMVVPPGFRENRGYYPYDLMKRQRSQLRDLVGPLRGRTLHLWKTRWIWLMNTPSRPRPGAQFAAAHIIQAMANGLPDEDFPSELIFAPTTGIVTEIMVEEIPFAEDSGLRVTISGDDGRDVQLGSLGVVDVEVGETVQRGQWIGFRRCD